MSIEQRIGFSRRNSYNFGVMLEAQMFMPA